MKNTTKTILLSFVFVFMLILSGCLKDKLVLNVPNNVTSISQGETLQITTNDEKAKFEVTQGFATIDATGLLTCNEEAEIGSKITVTATSSLGSAQISFIVTQAKVNRIQLNASSTTIKKGDSVTLSVNYYPTSAEKDEVTYEVINGSDFAKVENDQLTIKNDAVEADIIGKKIIVKATTKVTKVSDEIEIEVKEANIEAIELKTSNTTLIYGKSVELFVSFIPAFKTGEYSLSIVEGAEYIDLIDHTLTIKESMDEATINAKKVTIRATLKENTNIYDDIEIILSEREKIDILVEDKNIIAGIQAVESLLPEAYDKEGNLLDLTVNDYTFTSSDTSILTIGEHDGKITPVGHGMATVSVKYQNSEAKCNIYVMVVPEAIDFNDLSVNTMKTHKYYYSYVEELEFNISLTTLSAYQTASTTLTYKFELLDESGNVVTSGDEVATVNEGKISFNKIGNVKVTITTNSSLNNKDTSSYEKSTSIIVAVNDGVNIRTVADLKSYAAGTYEGKAANFINDIYITATDNFGIDSANRYSSLEFFGDRYLYGNGYVVSTSKLELIKSTEKANDLFYFKGTSDPYFTVEIYDLELVGIVDVMGQYMGELDAYKGQSLLEGSDLVVGFRRALRIGQNVEYDSCRPVKDLVISNVKVSGFYVGLRLDHVVDGYVTDINISQCLSNGIECNQNIITFNNMYVGQVGAFAIEMVPDDIKKVDGVLKTCAGLNLDEAPKTTLTGYIDSTNFNNGKSTPYMSALSISGYTIPDILNMILNGKIQYAAQQAAALTGMTVEQCQTYLADLANKCIFKDGDAKTSLLNFFLLVFVDPTDEDFLGYNKGNKDKLFGTYESGEEDANMITIDQILTDAITTLATGGSYDAYKNYKYILLDLDLTSTQFGVNLGEVVIVNEAYTE